MIVEIKKIENLILSLLGRQTSGVLSLTANPVPPVVTTRLRKSSPSAHWQIDRWISRTSSGTILICGESHLSPPSEANVSNRALPALSVDGSRNAVSDIIKIAALSFVSAIMIFIHYLPDLSGQNCWECCRKSRLKRGCFHILFDTMIPTVTISRCLYLVAGQIKRKSSTIKIRIDIYILECNKTPDNVAK